jgi:hypothetical protein
MPSSSAVQPSAPYLLGNGPCTRDISRRFFRRGFHFFLLAGAAMCVSCGGYVSAPPPLASLTVMPQSAQPFPGASVQFAATVQNSGPVAVNWQVNNLPGGNSTLGTIGSSGLYTAPTSVPNPPTVTVTAVSQSDAAQTGSSSVTIQSLSAIQGPLSLSPALSSVTTSQTLQLQVLTAGVTNNLVNWSVDGVPGGNGADGTISANGLYAPSTTGGPHLILAILQANPNAIGSAQVEVTTLLGVLTWRNDNSRSGVNNMELALGPTTVSSSTFGKLFSCPIDGYAYAQPLYVANLAIPGNGTRNVVFVATEKDSVFAFDADASPCVQLWHTTLIPAGSQAVLINLSTSTLYVVAKTWTTGSNPVYSQLLYALDLASGQPKILPNGAQIGSPPGVAPAVSYVLENQRAALLLDNNTVYVALASHGGLGAHHGWLLGYDSSTMLRTLYFDDTPNGINGGGIWQSGGGPAADANHNVYVLTGDGPFDAYRGGIDYSDSFLRLGTAGALAVADYFSPCDEASLANAGLDVGASAPLLLPDSAGSAAEPHLLIGASKNSSLYLANRDNLGGYNSVCPDISTRVQTVPVGDGQILSTPIFWNNAVYVAAGNGKLKAFPVTGGVLASSPLAAQSAETFGSQGATPTISSNGTNNALLWLIDSSGALATPNTAAILRAFAPNNLSNEIYNSAMVAARDTAGLAVKFTVPTVANAKVYVGTQTELDVYGLLH